MNIDEFVAEHFDNDRSGEHDKDFRLCGGDVLIINPDGNYCYIELGIFKAVRELMQDHLDSGQSRIYQNILPDDLTQSAIFKNTALTQLVQENIILVNPSEETEVNLRSAIASLYKKFQAFLSDLPEERKQRILDKTYMRDFPVEKLSSLESATEIMQALITTPSMSFMLQCFENWITKEWHLDLPDSYKPLVEAFQDLKGKIHSGNYQISLSQQARESQYLLIASVHPAPKNYDKICIVDTIEELNALSFLANVSHTVLYRGSPDSESQAIAQSLFPMEIISANLKGPKELIKCLAERP